MYLKVNILAKLPHKYLYKVLMYLTFTSEKSETERLLHV